MSARAVSRSGAVTAVLTVAGAVLVGVGAWALVDPVTFHEAFGITAQPGLDTRTSADAASETRAAGALLLAIGVLVVRGGLVPARARTAATWGAVTFLAYAAGRVVGLVLDGAPGAGLVQAAAIEAALGLACVAVRRRTAA